MPEQRSSGWESVNHYALRQDEILIGVATALSLRDETIGFDLAEVSDRLAVVRSAHAASPDDIQAALEFHEPKLGPYGPMKFGDGNEQT